MRLQGLAVGFHHLFGMAQRLLRVFQAGGGLLQLRVELLLALGGGLRGVDGRLVFLLGLVAFAAQ